MPDHQATVEFSQITPFIFLGTNLCCLARSHIQVLMDIGISAEIDLERERQDSAPDVEVYLWLPVPDKQAPTQTEFQAGVSLLRTMEEQKKKTYVHCQLGHGRSPTMVAAFLISKGASMEDAIAEIKQRRPEIHLEDVQVSALEVFASSVR